MLDFAILGLPRSGTTWAANWLTTDNSLCLHDPLVNRTLDQLQDWAFEMGHWKGVACTGLWMFPDWVKDNVACVVLVDRPVADVNRSLIDIGLGSMPDQAVEAFMAFPGKRVAMADLFKRETAAEIWGYLLGPVEFNAERHQLLTGFMVNPYFPGWEPDTVAVQDWMARVQKAANT